MGRSTDIDVVPFVAHSIVYEDNSSGMETYERIFEPECYEGDEPFTQRNGWRLLEHQTRMIGKRGRLFGGTAYAKGHMKVTIINEHQWANGGAWDMSLVADSAEAIKAFYEEVLKVELPEIGVLPEILADDAVQQSL